MAKDLTAALHDLTEQARGQTSRRDTTLPSGIPVSAIPERVGTALPGGQTGGSIASPLTEVSYVSRTYWDDVTITSTDGIFTMVEKPIKSMSFTDPNDNSLVINYAEPI